VTWHESGGGGVVCAASRGSVVAGQVAQVTCQHQLTTDNEVIITLYMLLNKQHGGESGKEPMQGSLHQLVEIGAAWSAPRYYYCVQPRNRNHMITPSHHSSGMIAVTVSILLNTCNLKTPAHEVHRMQAI
jgi:hypothetical protein